MSRLLDTGHALLQSPWLAPLNDRHAIERLLQTLRPLFSLATVRARIESIEPDGRDAASLWLRPNRHWQGHRAGQHLLLSADIDGVRQQRAFSLSSAPRADGCLRLSVRRSPRMGVSAWLQSHQALGQVVELSQAKGEFVLPAAVPDKLLMIAGGSGISPIAAMLESLAAQSYQGDIVLLHAERQAGDCMLRDQLACLTSRLPGLQLIHHYSAAAQRLDKSALRRHAPDLAERAWFVCGPGGLMQMVQALHADTGVVWPLQQERFAAPSRRPAPSDEGQYRVYPIDGTACFEAEPGLPLLQAAEAAGLSPAYGCRAGICRSCLCQKRSGSVRNLLTGLRSDAPDEWIQLCISSAESDLELALDGATPPTSAARNLQ